MDTTLDRFFVCLLFLLPLIFASFQADKHFNFPLNFKGLNIAPSNFRPPRGIEGIEGIKIYCYCLPRDPQYVTQKRPIFGDLPTYLSIILLFDWSLARDQCLLF